MRKIWSGDTVEHKSEFLDWTGFKSYPVPVQSPLPVVIGGTDAPVRAKIPLDPVLAEQIPGQCQTPWHQDAIFRTNTDCDDYLSVQCWIPLVDATIERGCLHFIPYRFEEGLLPHYHGGGFYDYFDKYR